MASLPLIHFLTFPLQKKSRLQNPRSGAGATDKGSGGSPKAVHSQSKSNKRESSAQNKWIVSDGDWGPRYKYDDELGFFYFSFSNICFLIQSKEEMATQNWVILALGTLFLPLTVL